MPHPCPQHPVSPSPGHSPKRTKNLPQSLQLLGQKEVTTRAVLGRVGETGLTPGVGWASGAGPGARAGVFGMGPSWWVACQVEVEQLCQMGSQQGVPPASQPWASGSLVTCQAAAESESMGAHNSVAGSYEAYSPFLPSLFSARYDPEQHNAEPGLEDQEQRGAGNRAEV